MNAPVFTAPPVSLDTDQKILIALLQGPRYVKEWRHLMQGAMIRLVTSDNKSHTLRLEQVQFMVDAGLMFPDYGGSFVLSMRGKELEV